jgi:hypothetical protein
MCCRAILRPVWLSAVKTFGVAAFESPVCPESGSTVWGVTTAILTPRMWVIVISSSRTGSAVVGGPGGAGDGGPSGGGEVGGAGRSLVSGVTGVADGPHA